MANDDWVKSVTAPIDVSEHHAECGDLYAVGNECFCYALRQRDDARAALATIAASPHEQRWDTPTLRLVCVASCRACVAQRALERSVGDGR